METTSENPNNLSTREKDQFKLLIQKFKKSILLDNGINKNSIGTVETFGLTSKIFLHHGSNYRHKLRRVYKELKFAKRKRKKYENLSTREKEIIKLLSQGLNNPGIAEQLFISRFTVEQHRKNINRKLKIKSFVQIIWYAQAFDLD